MDAVMAFDLGTTHLKWAVVEAASGLRLGEGRFTVAASADGPASEQDPDQVLAHVRQAIGDARSLGRLRRIAFSAAMHSLVAATPDGRPLSGSWTWMDKRAAPVAARLRHAEEGHALRRRTGVPVHAMSPLVKWLWMKEGGSLPADARPIALKDYIVHDLTGRWLTDCSTASASGFLSLEGGWLREALTLGGLSAEDMPALAPIPGTAPAREGDFEVVLGGNDAATAHHHLGVPMDGSVGVLAMGTSGALRTTLAAPVDHPELFCYTNGPGQGFLVGSAFSNVGNLIDWLAKLFSLTDDAVWEEGIRAAASGRPLPLALDWLFGERSPWWRDDLEAAWVGLRPEHGRGEIVASALLSMAAAYWHGLEVLRGTGAPVAELRGGSGLLDRPLVAQWMADALGQDIVLHDERDASLLGAVDLALGRTGGESGRSGARYRPRDPNVHEQVAGTWERIVAWVGSRP